MRDCHLDPTNLVVQENSEIPRLKWMGVIWPGNRKRAPENVDKRSHQGVELNLRKRQYSLPNRLSHKMEGRGT